MKAKEVGPAAKVATLRDEDLLDQSVAANDDAGGGAELDLVYLPVLSRERVEGRERAPGIPQQVQTPHDGPPPRAPQGAPLPLGLLPPAALPEEDRAERDDRPDQDEHFSCRLSFRSFSWKRRGSSAHFLEEKKFTKKEGCEEMGTREPRGGVPARENCSRRSEAARKTRRREACGDEAGEEGAGRQARAGKAPKKERRMGTVLWCRSAEIWGGRMCWRQSFPRKNREIHSDDVPNYHCCYKI